MELVPNIELGTWIAHGASPVRSALWMLRQVVSTIDPRKTSYPSEVQSRGFVRELKRWVGDVARRSQGSTTPAPASGPEQPELVRMPEVDDEHDDHSPWALSMRLFATPLAGSSFTDFRHNCGERVCNIAPEFYRKPSFT